MEIRQLSIDEKPKRSLILKALDRCRSLTRRRNPPPDTAFDIKQTWQPPKSQAAAAAAPRPGRFTVHVGPSKERFVIKTECIGHPLFQALLDQAELAFGFASPGPLQLPCDVDLFRKVMCEVEQEMTAVIACGAVFGKRYSAGSRHQLLSPSRFIVAGGV